MEWEKLLRWTMLLLLLLVILLLLLLVGINWPTRRASPRSVAIVVLGDIGRSPRMMYHARSFVDAGWLVYLVGYAGTPILDDLQTSRAVSLVHIPEPPKWFASLPRAAFLVLAPLKLAYGALGLLYALVIGCPSIPRLIFVQTPPALPTLPVVQLARVIMGSRLIIDWHNTAYSILAMRLGNNSPFCRLAKALEGAFGRHAFAHIFVTEAMKQSLTLSWKLSGQKFAFHDRPQGSSERLTPQAAHDLFFHLSVLRDSSLLDFLPTSSAHTTPFTREVDGGTVEWRSDRPALLVSSTSWTIDEDFSILISALESYEARARMALSKLPKLLVLITGKGSLKAQFESKVAILEKEWKHVRCRTAWLEIGDYPKLLGAADLGVSLHSSSSGIDLPMKVVDMFGAGLPVLALDFPCLDELVKDGVNGRIFRTPEQLAEQLCDCLTGFPVTSRSSISIDQLRVGVQKTASKRWQEAWSETVRPVVEQCCK